MSDERWVEVWSGAEPAIPGRKLEAEGIEMRLAAGSWGAHGGGFGFSLLTVLMKKKQSRLLVKEADRERAKLALKGL
jgi:hypothetical protein